MFEKARKIAIIMGVILYFSRFSRSDVKGFDTILYWLGFIPNFGMSLAFPFVFFGTGGIFPQIGSKINFYMGCLIVFITMILGEIADIYQPRRVLDWMDIWASLVGVLCAAFIYYFILKNEKNDI